ncbi:MAG: PD-(D/E)XK nuclease family protein [Planctomycetes bacterium]|nr:PD-(D/E)XK nuclease family protein [Planctomycetota bacterium]
MRSAPADAALLEPDEPLPSVPRLLLTGPAGTGKTWRALEAVREVATREGPHGGAAAAPGAALFVLPTYAAVQHMRRVALSRWEARGLLDEVFTTFTGAGERFLSRFRVGTLPSAATRDRLVVAALDDAAPKLFAAVAGSAAFRARLLRLMKELKQGGLPPELVADRLEAATDAVSAPARERLEAFLAVFRAYHRRLAEAGLHDHEDALVRLARRLEDEPPTAPPRRLVVDGFEDLTPIEQRILDRLVEIVVRAGGEVLVTCPFDVRRAELFSATGPWRAHLLGQGFVERRAAAPTHARPEPLARLAADLFTSGDHDEPTAGGSHVAWLLGGDDEDEAESVARHLRRAVLDGEVSTAGRPIRWHDVAIVVRDTGRDAGRFIDALERVGVPVRAGGAAATLGRTPLVRALRGALDVAAGHVEAGAFEPYAAHAWLAWCVVATGDDDARAAHDTLEVKHRRDGAPRTWDAWRAALPEPLASWAARLEAVRERLAPVTGASAFEELRSALDELAPLPTSAGLDADGRPRDARHDASVAAATAAAWRLREVVTGLADAARRTGVGPASPAEAVEDVLAHVDALPFTPRDRRLDAVTVLDMETARFWEPALVVVAGLEAGRVPKRPRQDILLADDDREALAERDAVLRLPRARDREVRERRLLYTALTAARSVLWLSRPTVDGRGEGLPPAFPLRALVRCVTPSIRHETGAPGVTAPRPDLVACAHDLVRLAVSPGTPPGLAAALVRALPAAQAARERGRARRATRFGLPEELAAELAHRFKALSPSEVETAHTCRVRHLFQRTLRVPEDDLGFEPRGLEPADEGQVLHAAFRLALLDGSRAAEAIAKEALEASDIDADDAPLLVAETVRAIELLRLREATMPPGLAPAAAWLERAFAPPKDTVPIGEGEGAFLLKGRIDRVDVGKGVPKGRAVVVDYKRSATAVESSYKADREGRGLQLRLYAEAVEALAPLDVVGVEWAAALVRLRRAIFDKEAPAPLEGRREGKAPWPLSHADFVAHRKAAVDAAVSAVADLRAARLDRAPLAAEDCASCPWRRPCRPDPDAVKGASALRVLAVAPKDDAAPSEDDDA